MTARLRHHRKHNRALAINCVPLAESLEARLCLAGRAAFYEDGMPDVGPPSSMSGSVYSSNITAASGALVPLSSLGIHTYRDFDDTTGFAYTRYWSDTDALWYHDDSGQTTTYSPDGKWLGIYMAESERWLLIDRESDLARFSHDKGVGANGVAAANSVLQWTENSTLLVLAGNEAREINPTNGTTLRTLVLATPNSTGADYNVWRSGEATGQRYLYVSHERFQNNAYFKTISVIDSRTWSLVNQFSFDANVHQGVAIQDYWRHLYLVGDQFYCQLELVTVPNSPQFRFNLDGTGWEQIDNLGPTFPPFRQRDLSHPAYSTTRVVAGDTGSSFYFVADLDTFATEQSVDTQQLTGTSVMYYHHAAFAPSDQIVFSLFDTTDDSDERVYIMDPQTGATTLMATPDHLATPSVWSFQAFSRPQIALDQIGWHSNVVDRSSVEVYTMDLAQGLTLSDFGDAPAPYPTRFHNDGPRHEALGTRLGDLRDGEGDGAPSADAGGDNLIGQPDEDGVTLPQLFVGQPNASVSVDVQREPGYLDAWIDFNADGVWTADEKIFDSQRVAIGTHTLNFSVPVGAVAGTTYARFRLSTAGHLGVTGRVADGEVEDYRVTIVTPASVVGRHIFYNNSSFDGNDPNANAADDGAIDRDKSAFQPGVGMQASFVNYTSYSRGINGIMVDVANLADPGRVTASQFEFRVGNNNTPSSWPLAPAPLDVCVRVGAGDFGSDRITIVWADNDFNTPTPNPGSIARQWLQVTVKSTDVNGLVAIQDVHYWGNAVGEVGNVATNAIVNATDEIEVRRHPAFLPPATVQNRYDFNRDRLVNATDQIISRKNGTFLDALQLISPSNSSPIARSAALADIAISLFEFEPPGRRNVSRSVPAPTPITE